MNKTKKKIIVAAVSLFNENGMNNIRNQDIAAAAGISLSNFNYHFKTKQDLVHAVFAYMVEVLKEQVYGNKVLIQEGQGLEITKAYFKFEKNFRFFYLDTHNILQTYPELKEGFQKQIKEAILIIKNLNYIAIGKGLMMPEPIPGLYDQLAEQIWVNNHFWFAQIQIRGEEKATVRKGMETCYTILYPYLTEKGRHNYKEYLENLLID